MKYFLGSVRILLIIIYTFIVLLFLMAETLIKGRNFERGLRYSMIWGAGICKLIGLVVEIKGNIPSGSLILMPNHRSYSDIFVFISLVKSSFVSKAELRAWPLIGYAADLVGTMFVKRTSQESRKQTISDMKYRINKAYAVTIFPEGTTFKGPGLKQFKKGTFMMAAEGLFPIVPAAIEYQNPDDAWVGDDTFLPHFIRTFGRLKTPVKIHFGEKIQSEDWELIYENTNQWITESVHQLRKEWDSKIS